MPKVLANGIHIYYEERGDPQNPLLILIGGLTRDHTIWSEVLKQEGMKQFRVIVYDNRGSGQTDQPEGPYSSKLFADDLNAFMEKLGLSSAIIVGHSMGGFAAQYLAAYYPKQVAKLILCSTCMRQSAEGIEYLKGRLDLCRKKIPMEQMVQTALPWLYTSEYLTEDRICKIMEGVKSMRFPQTYQALEAQILACIQHDSRSILSLIQVPTLVVTGKEDRIMTPDTCREFASKLSNGSFLEIAHAAHMIQIERPKELSQIIQNFGCS